MTKKYAVAAGVNHFKEVTPAKLRNTFAVETIKSTDNLFILQKQLGHFTIKETVVYEKAARMKQNNNRIDCN